MGSRCSISGRLTSPELYRRGVEVRKMIERWQSPYLTPVNVRRTVAQATCIYSELRFSEMIRSALFLKHMQFDINTRRPFKRYFGSFFTEQKGSRPVIPNGITALLLQQKLRRCARRKVNICITSWQCAHRNDKTLFSIKRFMLSDFCYRFRTFNFFSASGRRRPFIFLFGEKNEAKNAV